ncbi:hypothetical protein LOAG_17504 [Loa loa]|uniref:Uncharacterized protein n=1 Tax=Loa loa TaxID=7209 RepID=A0A1S0UIY4_LOALO|nr:hypothetical protein LOAG_17504 [Loa loa]EJD75328.1 hypothetical protein LOAG_17504 [Loa loa]
MNVFRRQNILSVMNPEKPFQTGKAISDTDLNRNSTERTSHEHRFLNGKLLGQFCGREWRITSKQV